MRPLLTHAILLAAALTSACAAAPQAADPAPQAALAQPQRFDARLSRYDYPFPTHAFALRAQQQDLELVYMDLQPAQPNGQTVLLLHGKNFSGAYWERTARALADQGFRVVMPDQIGFGKSSKPKHFHYSFGALATITRDLLDHLQLNEVSVVGHSMGGMIAARFALMFPDRARSLTLVNPIGLEDWQDLVPYSPIDDLYAAERAKTPEKIRAYMQESYFDGTWDPAYDDLAALQMGWTQSPDRDLLAWTAAVTHDMIFTQPVVHDLPLLRTPTLLIIGTRDRTALNKHLASPEARGELGRYDRLGRAAAAAIPGARLVEIEGVGHLPQFEAWDAYSQALFAFLNPPPAP